MPPPGAEHSNPLGATAPSAMAAMGAEHALAGLSLVIGVVIDLYRQQWWHCALWYAVPRMAAATRMAAARSRRSGTARMLNGRFQHTVTGCAGIRDEDWSQLSFKQHESSSEFDKKQTRGRKSECSWAERLARRDSRSWTKVQAAAKACSTLDRTRKRRLL